MHKVLEILLDETSELLEVLIPVLKRNIGVLQQE